jgi:hypothetical protein
MESNKKQKLFRNKLKKNVIDGKTIMYGRERTDEEKYLFKKQVLKLYINGKGI